MKCSFDINELKIPSLYNISPLDTVLSEQIWLEKLEWDIPRVFSVKKTAVALSYSPKLSLEELGKLFVLSQSSNTCLSCFLILNEVKIW